MGQGPGSQHSVESPTEPGQLSVLTDSLEDWVDDFDLFWINIVQAMRDPRDDKMKQWMSKSLEIIDHDSDEGHTSIITWDGSKMMRLIGQVWPDWTQKWVYNINKKERKIEVTKWESPFRMEMYAHKNNNRWHGPILQLTLMAWVNLGILEQRGKCKANYNVISETHGGVVVHTQPLDEHFDSYDDFFSRLSEVIVEKMPSLMGQLSQQQITTESFSDSETETRICFKPPVPEGVPPEQVRDIVWSYHTKVDPARGEITIVASVDNQLYYTEFYRVDSDPLVVDVWGVSSDGARHAGRDKWLEVVSTINIMIYMKSQFNMF